MKTTGVPQSSSFFKCGFVTLTYATHPNVHRKLTSGLWPCQASYRVMSLTALVGARFSKKTTMATASPQNIAGMFRLFSSLHAMVTIV
jgi:hypothetical protein